MKQNAVAINTMEIVQANGELPEWVCLVPAGAVVGRDGRSWNNSRPEGIIASFSELARDLPIDIEHSTELKAPKGEPAPAIGWVKNLEARNGEIWGRVQWNPAGRQLVGEQSYRYLSPVIIYQPNSGTIVGLTSVGVTNQPNLKLPALNHQHGVCTPEENIMLKALLAALALPENAGEAEALAKVTSLKSELATATNRAENPSLEKFVPRADYDAALGKANNAEQQLAQIKKDQLETAVNTAIEQALKDGKITPATADYHRAQCRQEGGLERFKTYCAAAPVLGGDSGLGSKEQEGTKALNAEQEKIAGMFGNSAEDLAKYGK
jgi:phage I-like protein